MRQGVCTCFEGPCAIVEMAHETMLAFREMVDRRECNTLDEQLLHFVDHSGDVRSFSERDPSCCIDALHAHQPIYVGNGISLVPRIADIGASQSARRLRTAALLTIAVLGATAAAYSLVVLILGRDLFVLVYNKPEVTGVIELLWLVAIYAILEAVTSATALVLMANGITRFNFWSRFALLAVLVPGTVCLGMVIGLDGIMWAATAGSALSAFLHGLALVRFLQRQCRSAG